MTPVRAKSYDFSIKKINKLELGVNNLIKHYDMALTALFTVVVFIFCAIAVDCIN